MSEVVKNAAICIHDDATMSGLCSVAVITGFI